MTERALALATDLYELTMAAAYFDNRIDTRAIFELFVRRLPPNRAYLVTAGLEQAIDYLSGVRFTADEVAYLREHPAFSHVSQEFFDYLADFRFTGDVWAMPEGTVAFGNEPLLRVAAPILDDDQAGACAKNFNALAQDELDEPGVLLGAVCQLQRLSGGIHRGQRHDPALGFGDDLLSHH